MMLTAALLPLTHPSAEVTLGDGKYAEVDDEDDEEREPEGTEG